MKRWQRWVDKALDLPNPLAWLVLGFIIAVPLYMMGKLLTACCGS